MSRKGIIENRYHYFLRFIQTVIGIGGLTASIIIWIQASYWSAVSGVEAWWYVCGGAGVLAVSLLIVGKIELSKIKGYGFNLIPPDRTLKSWNPAHTARSQTSEGRWASSYELWRWRWKTGDHLIGRPVPEQRFFQMCASRVGITEPVHLMTIAKSQFGKGTACLIPNLLLYPGSAVVIDPKGELAAITANRRGAGSQQVTDSLGQDVYVIDPFDIVEEHETACFNPMAELDVDSPTIIEDAANLANILVPEKTGGADNEFFDNRARALVKALILHVLSNEEPERQTLPRVRALLMHGDIEEFKNVQRAADQEGLDNPFADPQEALWHYMSKNHTFKGAISGEAKPLTTMVPETRDGIISTATAHLDFIEGMGITHVLSRSDFRLSDLKAAPTTIYLCLPGTEMKTKFRKLLVAFLDMTIRMAERTEGTQKHKILLAMDEFSALGRLPMIELAAGLMGGLGVTLWPIVQDVSQLKRDYPESWENYAANCAGIQIAGVFNNETAKWVSEKLGVRYVDREGVIEQEPLLRPEELQSDFSEKELRRQVWIQSGKPPALLELVDYYQAFPKNMYDQDKRSSEQRWTMFSALRK